MLWAFSLPAEGRFSSNLHEPVLAMPNILPKNLNARSDGAHCSDYVSGPEYRQAYILLDPVLYFIT